ncbi:MAG: DUF362 domain-containing protein [Candidatus Bathyarchaeia archaeon]
MIISAVSNPKDERKGIREALNLIKEDVYRTLPSNARILIKPNFVSAYDPLSATPVECVEETLKFLMNITNPKEIIVAESPTIGSFNGAVKSYGYTKLRDEYGVELCDLDEHGHETIEITGVSGSPLSIPVSKLVLESDFRVSPVRPKTHDFAVVTLTIKNMVVGSIKRGYRRLIHQGYWQINHNIAEIAVKVMPHLSVVDGYESMEGNGPVYGNLKRWGAYFASTSPVSLDATVAFAMGFNPSDIGYLYLLSKWGYGEIDPKKINIIGENLNTVKTIFKPHRDFKNQLEWKKHLISP